MCHYTSPPPAYASTLADTQESICEYLKIQQNNRRGGQPRWQIRWTRTHPAACLCGCTAERAPSILIEAVRNRVSPNTAMQGSMTHWTELCYSILCAASHCGACTPDCSRACLIRPCVETPTLVHVTCFTHSLGQRLIALPQRSRASQRGALPHTPCSSSSQSPRRRKIQK
jgi:hypothetical protein